MAEKKSTKKRYIEAVGRRKTSVARVRITPDEKGEFVVNGMPLASYFPTNTMRMEATNPLRVGAAPKEMSVSAKIMGGGKSSQSEALRHGVSRALVKYDEAKKHLLKQADYLKRDPRSKERRKFGLKKARKAAQWSKR